MAKLYGKGEIKEVIKGKKYYITLSAGKDPLSGRVFAAGKRVPDNACAINSEGKQIKPRIVWGEATDEQKGEYERWQEPVKYLRHFETFLGTKRQAELRVEEIRKELESGKAVNADKVTFAKWLEQYLSNRESMGKLRPATFKHDRCIGKHLFDGLGAVLVVDITPAMVTNLFASMRDKGIGDATIKQSHRLLKTVLQKAVDNDLITKNPVACAEVPKNPKPKRQSLSTEEANRLSAICTTGTPTANKTAVFLALATGARLGEIMGLTWAHIVLGSDRPFVHFVQQFTGANEIAPLKTDKDDNPTGRIIPLDASTVAVLLAWKSVQREQLNALGIEQGNDTPVITNQLGKFTNHSRFERWWRSFCVDNGFGKIITADGKQVVELALGADDSLYPESDYVIKWRDADGWPCDPNGKRYSRSYPRPKTSTRYDGLHFHALRHTHFSLRLAAGMDTITAQYLGGWSSPAMLMNVYAHPVAENIWASAGFMDKLTAKQTV